MTKVTERCAKDLPPLVFDHSSRPPFMFLGDRFPIRRGSRQDIHEDVELVLVSPFFQGERLLRTGRWGLVGTGVRLGVLRVAVVLLGGARHCVQMVIGSRCRDQG